MSVESQKMPILTGYHREDKFIATKKYMGGRPVYHLDMCISQLTAGVDAPPVGVTQDDNRIVQESRGKLFRDYVNDRKEWASPSLLLWCPIDVLDFEPLTIVNDMVDDPSVVLGILSVPRNSRQSIKILDGQHRILGFHMWMELLNKELLAAKANLAAAQKVGENVVTRAAVERVEEAEANLERSLRESIGIDVLVCSSANEARQIFADIANNAKGMVKALSIGFDQSKIVNRVTTIIASDNPHPILAGKVDFNKDRVAGASEFLISAKTLADIIRSTMVGISGRLSKAQDQEKNDSAFEFRAREFLDALKEGFGSDLAKKPAQLRESSLLGGGTMLRVLSGVWFELTSTTDSQGKKITPRMSRPDAINFFKKLAPHMGIPIKDGNGWLTTGVFPSPARGAVVTAPGSRNQELRTLTIEITNWALKPSTFPFSK
jgi:hypothetical protein